MDYPEKRRITWIDDETGELVGACDYYRHDLLEAARAEIAMLTKERDTDHANINLKADFIEATINQLALAEADLAAARAEIERLDRATPRAQEGDGK